MPHSSLSMIEIGLARASDAEAILRLQERNRAESIPLEERLERGFVPMEFTAEWLSRRIEEGSVVVARDREGLAGYLVVSSLAEARGLKRTKGFFKVLPELRYREAPFSERHWGFLAQVCLDDPYRGTGLVFRLYDAAHREFAPHYDFVVFQISGDNPRSLNFHLNKMDFEVIHSYEDEAVRDALHTRLWHVVVWNLQEFAKSG